MKPVPDKKKRLSNELIFSFILLFILVLVTYFNVLNSDFVSDDLRGVTGNPTIGDASSIFARPLHFFRPLLLFISHSIGGFTPFFYRIFNLFFHLGTVWSLYLILALLVNSQIALFAAALFAVHPILTESVTWISGVTYPQYSFFLMLSFYFYLRSKKNSKRYIPSLILFVFSMLSSEKAVVMPLLLICIEISFYSLKQNWKKIIPYFGIAGVVGGLFMLNIGARISSFQSEFYSKPEFYNPLEQLPIAISSYLQLIFWPSGLTIYHSELAMGTIEFIIRWIVLIILLVGIYISFKKSRFVFFWLCFFLLALSPTLIPLSIVWVVAERYAYLATAGVIAAFVYVLFKCAKTKEHESVVYTILIVLIIALMIRSIVRNIDWQNEDNLWIATGKTSPSSQNTHNNLGDVYGRRHDYARAIAEFKKAVEIKPDYADAYHNLANTYMETGNMSEAEKNYLLALKYNPQLWQSHQNLGALYYEQQKYDKALEEFSKAVEIFPTSAQLNSNLGLIYLKLGDKEKAKAAFYKALQIDPNYGDAKAGLSELGN